VAKKPAPKPAAPAPAPTAASPAPPAGDTPVSTPPSTEPMAS
jgi:hypothetical protein